MSTATVYAVGSVVGSVSLTAYRPGEYDATTGSVIRTTPFDATSSPGTSRTLTVK